MNLFFCPSLCILTLLSATSARAQSTSPAPNDASTSGPLRLAPFSVTDQLDKAREEILPELGATSFEMNSSQIENASQGENAPFNQLLLRAPGVAQDSAANGDLHVRGEHANLQYRINGVLLPEGISGFGVELDSHFVNSLELITGSLPAQYGFRTAGVVDIQTRSGALNQGGDFSLYGGSYDTFVPSVAYAGSTGKVSFFVNDSYERNSLGIENPTNASTALHDRTEQQKFFSYLSYLIDDTSRLSAMLSASQSHFQVPDTGGLDAGTAPNGEQWLPGSFDSTSLDENEREENYYAIVTYQKSLGDLNFQLSVFARESRVHFIPDTTGDLFFDGVASDVARKLFSGGLQLDGSDRLDPTHMLRGGISLLNEAVSSDSIETVFPTNANGDPTGPAFPVAQSGTVHGLFAGVYLQDEWKITPELTLNYGARFDGFRSSFDNETQLSPRINLVGQPSDSTTLHVGYSRYFTPPPLENVSGATVAKFNGTSNASTVPLDDPVKAERANYFDVGGSQKIATGFQIGLDGYYKRARNQLDDGLFGQTLILSAFNYAQSEIYGLELSSSYTKGNFSAYANLAHSVAEGKNWNSAQFLFDPSDLAYVKNHWIYLDHDQSLTGSFGVAYRWAEGRRAATRFYADALYGTGLRNDSLAPDGSVIPNGGTVPAYVTFNLGVEQGFPLGSGQQLKFRIDIVNLADRSYELRDGSGVGVNAAQYGMRRGFFSTATLAF